MEFIRAGRTRIFAAAKAILMAASAVALLAPAPAAAQNLVANGQFTNTTLASPGGYIC